MRRLRLLRRSQRAPGRPDHQEPTIGRAFYIVVAEPGLEEKPGIYGDQTTTDVWESEDEIRKAAHRFMRNGGLVNKLHEDMRAVRAAGRERGRPLRLHRRHSSGPHTVRKGSWYVAIAPTDEGRAAIENGELGGVSIQGTGQRVAKDAALVPNKPGVTNWVERTGGLPKYIADIAGDLITEKGKTTSNAIQLAVGIVQRWCRGEGDVTAATRAKSCAALAEWEAKRAAAHGMAKADDRRGRGHLVVGQLWDHGTDGARRASPSCSASASRSASSPSRSATWWRAASASASRSTTARRRRARSI